MEGFGNPSDDHSAPMPDMTPRGSPITPPPAQPEDTAPIKVEPLSNSPVRVMAVPSATALGAVGAGTKRRHGDAEGGNQADEEANDSAPWKKAKTHHPLTKIPGHSKPVRPAKASPATPSFNDTTRIAPDYGINARNASNGTPSPHLPNTTTPPAQTTVTSKPPSHARTTPSPPPWSPITPPPSPTDAQLQNDRQPALHQMLIGQFGAEEALLIINEWYRLGWMGLQGPGWRLPGLRELGLDVLYEPGQMGWFRWREMCFGRDEDEEEEQEQEEGNVETEIEDGVPFKAGISEWVMPGPRDFWSVVM